MQGEKGSLLELQRYHRGQHSRLTSTPEKDEQLAAGELELELDEEEELQDCHKDNLKALRYSNQILNYLIKLL